MLATYLVAIVVSMALFVLIVAALQWGLKRWVHIYAAVSVGAVAFLWLAQNIISGIVFCSQPPQYVPPAPGDDGEGMMLFNCDSAGGVIDRFYLYLIGPVTLVILGWMTCRYFRNRQASLKHD